MKISVLINNYNYGKYVVSAIESVLVQTIKVDEIIVVDDCSTDDSIQVLQANFSEHPTVKLILKAENGGQLSSFNVGFSECSGDLVFFLDADDEYKPDYIETAVRFYDEHPQCDFLFCAVDLFDNEERRVSLYEGDRDLGASQIATVYGRRWVGHRTSTLSCRRAILERFMPIPYLEDWRIRADDCLVFGSSVAGAHKYYLDKALVNYRVHGNNGHYGRRKERTQEYLDRYEQSVSRLFQFFSSRLNLSPALIEQAHLEFKSIPKPDKDDLNRYRTIVLKSKLSPIKKVAMLWSIQSHYRGKGQPSGKSAK